MQVRGLKMTFLTCVILLFFLPPHTGAVNLDEEQMQDLSYSRREELRSCAEAGYPLVNFAAR